MKVEDCINLRTGLAFLIVSAVIAGFVGRDGLAVGCALGVFVAIFMYGMGHVFKNF